MAEQQQADSAPERRYPGVNGRGPLTATEERRIIALLRDTDLSMTAIARQFGSYPAKIRAVNRRLRIRA